MEKQALIVDLKPFIWSVCFTHNSTTRLLSLPIFPRQNDAYFDEFSQSIIFSNFHMSGNFSVFDHASELLLYRFTLITKTHFQWVFFSFALKLIDFWIPASFRLFFLAISLISFYFSYILFGLVFSASLA